MSFAGLKKQINKANQFLSEKVGGAKGTELESEFVDMERVNNFCQVFIFFFMFLCSLEY